MKPQKLGPGQLTFNPGSAAKEFATMTTNTVLKPELKTEDAVALLSGDSYVEAGEMRGSISGTIYQEYNQESLINWILENSGKEVSFEFVPSTDAKLGYKGKCTITPVEIGGDVGKANTSSFEFPLTGRPTVFTPTSQPASG